LAAINPKCAAEYYCFTGIFVFDARHDSHFDDVAVWPPSLESSQQLWLEPLEPTIDVFDASARRKTLMLLQGSNIVH
jgi:hypothetical protein